MFAATTTLGKLARLPLRLIPHNAVVPILTGSARGSKWIAHSGLHSFWLGTFEPDKRKLFEHHIKPGMTVFDLGANVGYYTLIASRLVGASGQVIAFEPNPRNLVYLRQHMSMNTCSNVRVFDAAVSDKSGTAVFDDASDSHTGRLTSSGKLVVRTIAMDDMRGDIPLPDVVKMDIEGGEVAALPGMRGFLKHHPILFLATHGDDITADCCFFLRSIGYNIFPIDGRPLGKTREILATRH